MKLLIAFLLLSLSAHSQITNSYQEYKIFGAQFPRIKSTVALEPPHDTTSNKVINTVASISGIFYIKTSEAWERIGGPETDPSFSSSAAATLTLTDISHANTAFGWGNHAGLYGSLTQTNTNTTNISSNTTSLITKVEYVSTVEAMMAYAGTANNIIVKDATRGGIFTYYSTGYVFDNGVVFNATGKGSGFWVRNYTDYVHTLWFGADPTHTINNSSKFDSIIFKYPKTFFDAGTYIGQVNILSSHKTLYFSPDCIIDGGVIHLAIGTGPQLDPALYPFVSYVTDIHVYGKLRTTGRLGTYYAKDIFIEEAEILPDSSLWTYVGQTPAGSRGVDIHYGTQNLHINKLISNQTQVGGGYGISINSNTSDVNDSSHTKDIYIGLAQIDTATESGFIIDRASNVHVEKVHVKAYGSSGGYFGTWLAGAYDSHIGELIIDRYRGSNGAASSILLQANKNLTIQSVIVKNNPTASALTVNSTQANLTLVGKQNENVEIQKFTADSIGRAAISYQGSGVKINNSVISRTNYLNSNTGQIAITNAPGADLGNIVITDSFNRSDAISVGGTSTGIKFGRVDIYGARTNGVNLGAKNISFASLRVKNSGGSSLRYTSSDSIYIGSFESITPVTRDVTNLTSTNVSIGYKRGITFFSNPNAETGFKKIGADYGIVTPASGQSYIGDIVFDATTSTSNLGWKATASGSPGTWTAIPIGAGLSGTQYAIPRFNNANQLVDGLMTDNGTILTLNGTDLLFGNNNNYLRGKTSGGTSTRMLGLNSSNNFFLGSIDGAINDFYFINNGTTLAALKANGNFTIGGSSSSDRGANQKMQTYGSGYIRDTLFMGNLTQDLADYSATYTSRSHTDKNYVDNAIITAGLGGFNYVTLPNVTNSPVWETNKIKIFADSLNQFSWRSGTGYLRTFDGSALSANSRITIPGSGAMVLDATTQTLTNKTIDGGSNTVTGLNASSITAGTISTGRLPVSSILTYTTKQVFNGGIAYNVRTKTTAYTILNGTSGDYLVLADATSAGITQTLPTAVGNAGSVYVIKKIDVSANAVTVATTSSQTIDGSTTYSLPSQWKRVMVMSDGANWQIIDAN